MRKELDYPKLMTKFSYILKQKACQPNPAADSFHNTSIVVAYMCCVLVAVMLLCWLFQDMQLYVT